MISIDTRVTFTATEYASLAATGGVVATEGQLTTLTGTVVRGTWGRGRNVTIRTDDGRTFTRCEDYVTVAPEPESDRGAPAPKCARCRKSDHCEGQTVNCDCPCASDAYRAPVV